MPFRLRRPVPLRQAVDGRRDVRTRSDALSDLRREARPRLRRLCGTRHGLAGHGRVDRGREAGANRHRRAGSRILKGRTAMLKKVENTFSHLKAGQTEYVGGGLRDFFLYRDLGIAEATGGKVIAQLVKANLPPTQGTGWHFHKADFHIVIMLRGWARFMYEDKPTLVPARASVPPPPRT